MGGRGHKHDKAGGDDRRDACAHMHAQLPAQQGRSNKTPTQAAHDLGASERRGSMALARLLEGDG